MSNNNNISGLDARLKKIPIFYGWIVVAIVFITMGIGVNVRTSFSLLYPSILQEFGWDRATTAAAFTIGFISAGAFSPIIGRIMDFSAPRYLLSASALMVSAGLVLSIYATEPWHIYLTLGVMMIGTGVVMTYVGHSMFLPNWFEQKRGLAIGLAFSGVGIGSVFLMPILQSTISESGWRSACLLMAVLLVVVVVPLNLILQRKSPDELGLKPDGEEQDVLTGQTVRVIADAIVDTEWTQTDWTLKKAMKTGSFWWLCLTCSSGLYAWYAVQIHQTKYLIETGISPLEASFALGFVGFAGILGQIYFGHLSDRIGREWVWTLASSGFALCYLMLLMMEDNSHSALLYAMVTVQGGLGYALAAIFGSMPADLFQGRRYGEILGVVSLIALMGGGVGPYVTGYLYDLNGNYRAAFWLAFAICLVSIFSVWMTAPRKRRLVAGQAEKRAASIVTDQEGV
ncbi:MFS transporter [Sneathiella sp.]|jgi:MFS family permease|uniref:MFS transporter n=1 Tax=Sneathiella sp. TaxID=1964365 RepID=UPI0039E59779